LDNHWEHPSSPQEKATISPKKTADKMSATLPDYYTPDQLLGRTRTLIFCRLIFGQINHGQGWLREQIRRLQHTIPLMYAMTSFHTDYELSLVLNQVTTSFPFLVRKTELENYILAIKGEVNRLETINGHQFTIRTRGNPQQQLARLRVIVADLPTNN
jgi:hypothetical protein